MSTRNEALRSSDEPPAPKMSTLLGFKQSPRAPRLAVFGLIFMVGRYVEYLLNDVSTCSMDLLSNPQMEIAGTGRNLVKTNVAG